MIDTVLTSVKAVLADRLITALAVVLVLLAAGYCVYVGLSLRPSDLQVAVHYTSFGGTSFYRDKWYYLINFIVIGALVGIMHTALIIKLYMQGRRQIALLFAWLSLLVMVIAFFLTHAVLNIAFL